MKRWIAAFLVLVLRSETICAAPSFFAFPGLYIYVPRALVDSYKATVAWSSNKDKFRALEDWTIDGTITGELTDEAF